MTTLKMVDEDLGKLAKSLTTVDIQGATL